MINRPTHKIFFLSLKHFVLADIILALVVGGLFQFILVLIARQYVAVLSHGIFALVIEAVMTWFIVWVSSRFFRTKPAERSGSIALVATSFSILLVLLSLPFLEFLATVGGTTVPFLLVKDLVHVVIFWTATFLYFSDYSLSSMIQ